ncbi:hypothetical protein [Streptomyces sp. AHA2]
MGGGARLARAHEHRTLPGAGHHVPQRHPPFPPGTSWDTDHLLDR